MATKNTSPHIPSFIKAALLDSRPQQLTFGDLVNTNVQSTSSFKYDPIDSPIKNTQQLNIDWSKFENHTFFSSAEVKVNTAFDQIINGFPFDGTKKDVETFFDKISGFEKWVFENFPKFGGQLHFSGTRVTENPSNGFAAELGTWISVKDSAGSLYPDISKKQTGESILNPPANTSLTVEAQIFIPSQSNDRQVVFQKLSDDKLEGFTFYIEPSIASFVTSTFTVISGNLENNVSAILEKGKFNHVCMSINRDEGNDFLQFFVDENTQYLSKKEKNIGTFSNTPNLLMGSGSSFYLNGALVTPAQTFSGAIDEFRFFHSLRTPLQQKLYSTKGLYATDALKLYYRFNEPPTNLSSNINDPVNSIVLDSSGNALHATINNFNTSLRESSDNKDNPMVNEKPEFKTILFPYHPGVVALNNTLLASASIYDEANPNLITKLIPRHYLREGAADAGMPRTEIEGTLGNSYGGEGIPGQGQLGSSQIILTFLYIWAKFFDEIKLFVDAFKTLRTVDYALPDTIPDNFLNDFIRSYGFYLPPFFNSSNINQYVEGENVIGIGVNDFSLKQIQTQLLRRVLVNMPDVLKSKGTQHSIKSFLRSVGIDPNNSLRIREFGGPSLRQLGTCREVRSEPIPVLTFVSSSRISTPYLSGSRIEPGYPPPAGPVVMGVSTNPSDGLLTSGSWTYEGLYKYGQNDLNKITDVQSLVRFEVTGSSASAKPGVIVNLVSSGSLYALFRPGMGSNSPLLTLSLDVNVLDGERWSVSFGCNRNDSVNSQVSSSYFLRAATQNAGDITKFYATSSFFKEEFSSEGNAFRLLDSVFNASGSKITIGNDTQIPAGGLGYLFLNSTIDVDDLARASQFVGQVSNVKFWSKSLTESEWKEHIRNYKSFGVEDPLTNYNYVTNKSGSFERLRVDIIKRQTNRLSDDYGSIEILDFSENGFHASGSGFPHATRVLTGDIMDYSYLSPYFDEYSTSEKVRIRGFENEENLKDAPWATFSPVFELPGGETPLDDPRLSIEFSLIDTLNRDIVNMFSTFDVLANAIGSPELMFSPDYPGLENLRNVYFNRLSEKMNFRSFFEFYKWFDLSIGTFIEQLVPRKTRFKGTNFTIESHILERHKMQYQSSEIYLGDARARIKDLLLVQQISGKIGRY